MIYDVETRTHPTDGQKAAYGARYLVEANSVEQAGQKARARDLSQDVVAVTLLPQYLAFIA